MKLQTLGGMRWVGSLAAALLIFAAPALAGPPLICHAIDIGTAQSLPWSSTGWNLTGHENYDVGRVVADTLALLVPETPVLVRMETMRRATLFAAQRAELAMDLLKRLEARTRENPNDALAAFDYGYLAETYRQASWLAQHTDWLKASTGSGQGLQTNPAASVDGYALVTKASRLRGQDPEMEFAAALMSGEKGPSAAQEKHLQNAMAGAKKDAMLARNLASRFPKNVA